MESKKVAVDVREGFNHRALLAAEDAVFDILQTLGDDRKLMLERRVDLADHIEEQKAGMFADVRFVEDGIHFEYFREFVERIEQLIPHGDDELLPDDEVDLLGRIRVRVADSREVKDQINEILIVVDLRAQRWSEEFVRDDRMNIKFLHQRAYLLM